MTRAEMIEEAAQDVVTILMVDNKCKCLNRLRDAIALPLDSPPSPVATAEAVEMPSENDSGALIEALAELAHEQWSGWMIYLFGRSANDDKGNCVVPKEWANRWARQMRTRYADLTEEEKESDRKEARRVLEVLALPQPPADQEREVKG